MCCRITLNLNMWTIMMMYNNIILKRGVIPAHHHAIHISQILYCCSLLHMPTYIRLATITQMKQWRHAASYDSKLVTWRTYKTWLLLSFKLFEFKKLVLVTNIRHLLANYMSAICSPWLYILSMSIYPEQNIATGGGPIKKFMCKLLVTHIYLIS